MHRRAKKRWHGRFPLDKPHQQRHHRRPYKHCEKRNLLDEILPSGRCNIAIVEDIPHWHWHKMFNSMTAEQIFEKINRIWFDPDYELILRKR